MWRIWKGACVDCYFVWIGKHKLQKMFKAWVGNVVTPSTKKGFKTSDWTYCICHPKFLSEVSWKSENWQQGIWPGILKVDYLMLHDLILIFKNFKMFNPPPTKKNFTSRLWTLELCLFLFVSFFFARCSVGKKKTLIQKLFNFDLDLYGCFQK